MEYMKAVYDEVCKVLTDYEDDPSKENTYELYITLVNIANRMAEALN